MLLFPVTSERRHELALRRSADSAHFAPRRRRSRTVGPWEQPGARGRSAEVADRACFRTGQITWSAGDGGGLEGANMIRNARRKQGWLEE